MQLAPQCSWNTDSLMCHRMDWRILNSYGSRSERKPPLADKRFRSIILKLKMISTWFQVPRVCFEGQGNELWGLYNHGTIACMFNCMLWRIDLPWQRYAFSECFLVYDKTATKDKFHIRAKVSNNIFVGHLDKHILVCEAECIYIYTFIKALKQYT